MQRPRTLIDIARRAGMLDPRWLPALGVSGARWGPTLAAAYGASAMVRPSRAAVIDHQGSLSFGRLDRRSTAFAKGLRELGLRPGHQLGVLCRNHRDFVEATVGAAKLSLVPVYLNTGSAAPQLGEVLQREGVATLVADAALASVVEASGFAGTVIVADGSGDIDMRSVREMGRRKRRLPQGRPVPPVLLTSGTTGTPKGARRSTTADASGVVGLLELIPYRVSDVFGITSPLFHAWGLAQMSIAAALGAPVVLMPSFDADATLTQIEAERVTVLSVVPVVLQRLLDDSRLETADLSSLRIVASSGSALPASVVETWFDRVGPNIYNLYGSTEAGQATLATPAELKVTPNTAGRVLPGSEVAIYDDSGTRMPSGQVGRIFVGNGAQFDSYTGGGTKESLDGLMATGDVGHFDNDGLLFITGRADDMIISGGENVFPAEVEELLLGHPDVADVGVVGVEDEDFGQRLVAYVVRRPRSSVTSKRLRAHVADQLARHKVPRSINFVESLPRTATGKLRRQDLLAQ